MILLEPNTDTRSCICVSVETARTIRKDIYVAIFVHDEISFFILQMKS